MREYLKEKGKHQCTIKVGLMKAYDSGRWDFILHCFKCFGAPAIYVNWVKECITNPRFSVTINGTLVGYFEGGKGRLRQELGRYILSNIIAESALDKNKFEFHLRCLKLQLNHLLLQMIY